MKPVEMIPLVSGRSDFVSLWSKVCRDAQLEHDAWITKLRSENVKAAHPDDGWVDRERDAIHFAYPQFNDGAGVGDKIALGQPYDYRIVTITRKIDSGLLERWKFKSL